MESLTIPDTLYGREEDLAFLLEAFERIGTGPGEVMLVHGVSGAGKTSLVHELQGPVRAKNGFFVRGKFNQYQQNVPYFALKQALAELCRELRQADPRQRSRFRSDILQAVGVNGQLLVDLVPDFAPLLGEQPPLGALSPQEARHRFAEMLRGFLGTVCRPEHPLVMFIDDWQWADAASLELLKQMQIGTGRRYILFIASYRDNEIDANHPFLATVADLRLHATPVHSLAVNNLSVDNVRQMVAETLLPAVEGVDRLARLIHDRTRGNPFFARSLLLFLHERGDLAFDAVARLWRYLAASDAGNLPGDVVELHVFKLRRLDRETRNLLSLAACLGNRFELESLAIISGQSADSCLSLLLAPGCSELFAMLDQGDAAPASREMAFVHDRLQQAAYTLAPPDERPQLLLRIGRLLLDSLHPEQLSERVFEVANHLNAGRHLVQDPDERVRVAEVNLAAARKAFQGTAYSAALSYYREAARLLDDPALAGRTWDERRELAVSLLKELAVCEFLAGDRDKAQRRIGEAVARAATHLEKAEALCILIVQYTLLARYPEAIAAGRQALESLGIVLPERDYEAARGEEIARFRRELGERPVSSLAKLPAMTDAVVLMAAKILITMGPPCYRSHQLLWGVLVPKVVNLTLSYGNIPQIGYSHTAFGGLLGWVDDDYRTARELGEVATRLMAETFRNPADQSVFYLMIGSSVRHWSRHLKYGSQDYRDACETGLRSGNLQYAAYAFGHNMYCRFYQGVPLPGLILESRRSLEFSRVRLNMWASDLLEGGLHLFGLLTGEPPEEEGWSEENYLAGVEAHQNIQVTCIYRVMKACSLLHLGDFKGALELSDAAEPLIYTVGTQGLLPWPEHVFARLLAITSLFHEAEPARLQGWREELPRMTARLAVWAENSPENFRHKHLLVAAELARIEGRGADAMRLYDDAIESARRGDFLQWEAFANERAHDFWLATGSERLAHSYWQRAYILYSRWGAKAKVALMEERFRELVASGLSRGSLPPAGSDLCRSLAEKQLEQLREHARQVQQNSLGMEAVAQANELARATRQLRVEVAERKRTEEALRQSEDRFRKLFMEAPLGIALVDSSTGRLQEANPMLARISGRSTKELVSCDWQQITHPEDLEGYLDRMERFNAGGSDGFKLEKRYLRPDGSVVWVGTTVSRVAAKESRPPLHLCMVEEITARKEAEKAKEEFDRKLLQTQKLESLGVLAGGIAHDFNNILMAILGNAEMALMKVSEGTPLAENLRAIESASARAADLANQMLAYSGKGKFLVQAVDLNRLLQEMLHMLKVSISKRAALSLDLSDSLPALEADATQLRQVVMNLVINASEAIGDGNGVITVATSSIDCDRQYLKQFWTEEEMAEGRYVCLEVSDNGCGMEPETLSRIFDPFFTTKFVGRGLGMAAVLGIVRGHKGAIRVYSEPGRGSCFKILLPASGEAWPEQTAVAADDGWTGSGTVLLVDDEETVQETGSRMLSALGYRPVVARDGAEALQKLRGLGGLGEVAFVILDLTMPNMDGEQCLRELKSLRPELRVIMSSGYSEQEVNARLGREAAFIQKPYKLSQLKEVIRALEPRPV